MLFYYIAKIEADNFNTPSEVCLRKTATEAIAVAKEMVMEVAGKSVEPEEIDEIMEQVGNDGYYSQYGVTIAWGKCQERSTMNTLLKNQLNNLLERGMKDGIGVKDILDTLADILEEKLKKKKPVLWGDSGYLDEGDFPPVIENLRAPFF